MMRLLLMLILLSASSLVVSSQSASSTSPRRHLHRRNTEEHPDQYFHLRWLSSDDSDDSNDSADSNESNDDDAYNNNIVTQAKDRAEQDFSAMWSSPPSEWSQEYWEVFVGLLSLVMVGGLCVCLACIVPICFPSQDTAPSKALDNNNVMSNDTSWQGAHEPLDNATLENKDLISNKAPSHQSNQPILDQPILGQPISDQSIRGQPISDQPILAQPISDQPILGQPISDQPISDQPILGQPISDQPILDQPILAVSRGAYGSDYNAAETLGSKHRPEKKERNLQNLLSEVVTVWSEFFVEIGLFKEGSHQKYSQPYSKYKERPAKVPAGASARAKVSPRRNKYKAPSSRKYQNSEIEYETDDASSSYNEDEKFHGRIV
jgi:hypothetical protein